jgi:hypothetical protein
MKIKLSAICYLLSAICACGAAAHAASREGTPSYYQPQTPTYVGDRRAVQSLGQRSYTYQVPRPQLPSDTGSAMTPNGVSGTRIPPFTLSADYARRFANFEFKTGVNSVLKWDDMIFNEFGIRADGNFKLKNYDLFAYGEYRMGTMQSGGFAMDYDLEPYDHNQKDVGIFTISVGDQDGKTSNMKFAFGAKHIWDIGGWKLSPSIGYEIFKHDLEMSNHYYPNPAIYLPLLTPEGYYVFWDYETENYINVLQQDASVYADAGYYQVCLSPEDIALGYANPDGSLTTGVPYDPSMGTSPWGVASGQCVIVGGDGAILVEGTTHIYNTTWSGLFIGLELEKQMTYNDSLRLYLQVGMPKYSSEGIWPNRTDWQQHPSFIDEGNSGAYSYQAEMEYNYQVSERLKLSLKADMNFFHVGKIGGELYVAQYADYAVDANGDYIFTNDGLINGTACNPYVDTGCFPVYEIVEAHTEKIPDSLKYANWQSFSLHLGLKYSF